MEADLTFPSYLDSNSVLGTTPATDSILTERLDYAGSLRARLGYAAPRWLLYVTGGLAFAGELKERIQIVGQAADAVVVGNRLLQPLAVLHDLLAFFGLRPEVRRRDLCFGGS